MGILDTARTLAEVPTLLTLARGMKPRALTEKDCFGAHAARNAARFGHRTAMIFEDQQVTWAELNAMANRFAHTFTELGLERGDTASVVMENRIEFLATIVALNKIGVTGALINTNLRGRQLIHCITVTDSKKCIFGEELGDALNEAKEDLPLEEGQDYIFVSDAGEAPAPNWTVDLKTASADASSDNPSVTEEITLGENALYIYTSGTTGLPKAAVLSNRRYLQSATLAGKAMFRCTEQDRLYICLPLYHGTGLMLGVGSSLTTGASMFVRRKFSASNFLPEVRKYNTNMLIYIGELCRYLMNTPEQPDDADNPLHTMTGNGMRPDVWKAFKKRFGIKRVSEFYGASEGNVAFANLLNKDCTVGMTSATVALVKYDVDEDEIVKDANGRCIPVAPGEPGLLLGHINEEAVFEGYTDPEATEKKIVRNAFEEGDAWFNSGDLMRTVEVGYSLGYDHYQFVDRVGDTFRWKSENVSTNEVGEIINGFDGVSFCNVYGVEIPGADGRAGMAAIALPEGAETLDVEGLSAWVNANLPGYARPVFIRQQGDIDVTGTFKMVKGDLRKEGYDVTQVSEPLFVMKPGGDRYEPLDAAYAETIAKGEAGF